jgi:coenzyme PQQ precursor peptide PqqA
LEFRTAEAVREFIALGLGRSPIIRFIASVHEATDRRSHSMAWTKPEFTVVAVTLEVTAYAGKK